MWQKPNVSITPLEQKFPTAKTVRFTCEASGIPKPELLWFKDGELLHINGKSFLSLRNYSNAINVCNENIFPF